MSGRIRTIKPELLEDEKTGRLDDSAWRLFVSLFLLADDHGRFRADPDLLSGQVFWHSRKPSRTLASLLGTLATGKLVTVYRVRDQLYGQIEGWTKHQRVDKPSKPRVPGVEDGTAVDLIEEFKESSETLANVREVPARPRRNLAPDPDLRPPTSTVTTSEEHLASLDGESASPPAAEVVEKPVSGVIQIQRKFCALYAEWYPLKPNYDWEYKRDGRHAKSLLERNQVEEILNELEAYFGWKNPQVIGDGHTFSHGRSAFIVMRRQLNADMGAPQRHDVAAVLRQENYQRGKVAYERKLIGS